MRTLQRLSQARPARPGERPDLELATRTSRTRRERAIWGRRLRMIGALALLVASMLTFVWLVGGMRQVADGLVLAHPVEVTAPARVRVVEVHCRPGQEVRTGQPLLRLEPVGAAPERRPLELAVDEARLRLEWFEAGGEVWSFGEFLRTDRVAEAEQRAREAAAERAVAEARVAGLERERAEVDLELEALRTARAGAAQSAEERVSAAAAAAEAARTGLGLTRYDTSAAARLKREGVASSRELVSTTLQHDEARLTADGLEASQRAAERERDVARGLEELAPRQSEATLERMDARIAAARAEVQAAGERAELWRAMAEHHRRLDPAIEVDPARVRALRRALLDAELEAARARLAALDHRLGERTVGAEADGVVDEVGVAPGAVVEAGTPLVVYHSQDALRVVAYAHPELAGTVGPDQACKVLVEGGHGRLEGRVASVGRRWVELPPLLPQRATRQVDLRVPLVIEVGVEDAAANLAPNVRLKVVFSTGGVAGLRRRLASLLEL